MYKFYVSKESQKEIVTVNKNISVYRIIKNSTIYYGLIIKVRPKLEKGEN